MAKVPFVFCYPFSFWVLVNRYLANSVDEDEMPHKAIEADYLMICNPLLLKYLKNLSENGKHCDLFDIS